MPLTRKPSCRKNCRRRRGGALKDWAKKSHNYLKSKRAYSRGLDYTYNRFGKPLVNKKLSKQNAELVNKGAELAIKKIKQAGYGLRLSGNGLRRSGNGLRRSGNGRRMKY